MPGRGAPQSIARARSLSRDVKNDPAIVRSDWQHPYPGSLGLGAPAARRGVILAVLSLTVLIINLDGTILNVALPSIVASLHATSSQLQWIVDAYIIVLAGLLLIAGSLGDHIGRKSVFLGGLVLFALGSGA